jgi:hypothetical protein
MLVPAFCVAAFALTSHPLCVAPSANPYLPDARANDGFGVSRILQPSG